MLNPQNLAEEFIANVANKDCLNKLVECLETDDLQTRASVITNIGTVFKHILENVPAFSKRPAKTVLGDVQDKYLSWLDQQYKRMWDELLRFKNEHRSQHELVLETLVGLVKLVNRFKAKPECYLPSEQISKIAGALLSETTDMVPAITHFTNLLKEAGLTSLTLRCLAEKSETFRDSPPTDEQCYNFYAFISGCNVKGLKQDKKSFQNFNDAWYNFLACKLPSKLYREILVAIDKILPNIREPKLMADFMIESYNIGGVTSLLALNGLFILMHQFHVDYPNFYKKLYAILTPDSFHRKYRARFYSLLDMFLSSTHLPSKIIASFAKKLARMCLVAPPHVLMHLIPFICNLLIRHHTLIILVHNDKVIDMSTDPYDADEPDPMESKAESSSLWELKTMQSHWDFGVQDQASIIEKGFPIMEFNIGNRLEYGYNDFMKRALKRKATEAPLNIHKPLGFLKQSESIMHELWSV